MDVNVFPNVGTDNGVATHVSIVKRYSKHRLLNKATKGGIINIQAIGDAYKKIDVFTAHSYYADEQLTDYGKKANARLIRNAKMASRVICVSRYVQDFLVKNGVNRWKTVLIENPVDIAYLDMITPSDKKLPEKFALFIGDKGVKRPELFVELANRFPNDKFVAVGLPIKAPPNVTVLPKMSRDELLRVIRSCDIFLLLSKRESCPYALLEAMTMGKTCIASKFAGQQEIMRNTENGYTFLPDNIDNLCKAYEFAKAKPVNGRWYVEKYHDARIQVPKIDSVYEPPKVSVITYVHCSKENKRLPLLLEAIHTVKMQKFDDYEHVIIDDGSTIDLKGELLRLNDHHIKYYYKPHSGIISTTETFNMGFCRCQGTYCIILPSDDLHLTNTLSRLSGYLDTHKDVVAVVGNYIDQRYKDGVLRKESKVIRSEASIKNQLLTTNCVNAVGCMFRRSALEKITMPEDDTGFAADYDLWIKLSEVGPFVRIPDCIIKYRAFANATRFKTQKDMKYRQGCIDRIIRRAKRRRGLR